MGSTMTAGTRDLALSGSFVAPVRGVRLRGERDKPAAGYGWPHGRPTTHHAGMCAPAAGAALLHLTGLIGDVPVIDRMRMSARALDSRVAAR